MEHVLRAELELPLPIDEVFAFFSQAENLEKITPREVQFKIVTPVPIKMEPGTIIDYQIKIQGIAFRWRSRIPVWQPPYEFMDEQVKGPYAKWEHTHQFETTPGGTMIRDTVRYRLLFSPLGDIVHPFVRRQLTGIFNYRQEAVAKHLLGRDTTGLHSKVEVR